MGEIYVACFPLDYPQMPSITAVFLPIPDISGSKPVIKSFQQLRTTRNIRQDVAKSPNGVQAGIYGILVRTVARYLNNIIKSYGCVNIILFLY